MGSKRKKKRKSNRRKKASKPRKSKKTEPSEKSNKVETENAKQPKSDDAKDPIKTKDATNANDRHNTGTNNSGQPESERIGNASGEASYLTQKRIDLALHYEKKRESLTKLAFKVVIACLLIAGLSRIRVETQRIQKPASDSTSETEPNQDLKIPFVEPVSSDGNLKVRIPYLFDGLEIDTGDIVVFGPLAITLLVVWFDIAFVRCIAFGKSVKQTYLEDTQNHPALSNVETNLLGKPFVTTPPSNWINWFRHIPSRVVYIVALGCVFGLIIEYAQFRPEKKDIEAGFWSPFVGSPWFEGFEPEWPRFPEVDVVWIYPPWYPICYTIMVIYLAYRACFPPGFERRSRPVSLENGIEENSLVSSSSSPESHDLNPSRTTSLNTSRIST